MTRYLSIAWQAIQSYKLIFLLISLGFFVFYYAALLLGTMVRFAEIPNYLVFHDIIGIYGLIWEGTPSIQDMIPIMLDEAWIETGYKNPLYYGVATWSYMLIPPKMLLVLLMGILLALFAVLTLYKRNLTCSLGSDTYLFAVAGVSATFISLTSATLTWVVCCATPSWVVALAMLGMNVSLALFLEPLGPILTWAGFALITWVVYAQLKRLIEMNDQPLTTD